jgi:hypothetical protein
VRRNKAQLTQSPRELRPSTNDPEKQSRGDVRTNQIDDRDSDNAGAWTHYGEKYEPQY